ncbi:MAG: TonB-dependent receptor plug domain-containing protein, partial [Xanthomonas euvesicatoria]|nr:TonB-dependent receptor plug domain-containing protein [Xanthomonas euvesicatoria]NEL31058.1 TonB-dependent receptor plug domain-containing protein [Xanthomonas euvesicatoria]
MSAAIAPLGLLPAALLCALSTLAPAAHAAESADATNATTLDQVSVNGTVSRAQPATTTRLPLTLQETPQSVSVIGLQRLEEQSLFSIDDVMRNVTGVNVSFYDTQRPLYFARGFQITD